MLDVKPIKQSENFCGPASLKMVLSYYGVDRSEGYLARLAKASKVYGTKSENIVATAEKFGFGSYFKDNSSLDELEELVEKDKIPVIFNWFCEYGYGHYSVATGVKKKNLYYVEPLFGSIEKMPKEDFLYRWFDYKNVQPEESEDFIIRRIIVVKKNGIYRPKSDSL
jgi:ABC-type bacteriocin/lantibiotic exporter with double-glycine peptidase domain